MQVSTSSPDGPGDKATHTILQPTDIEKTQGQIHALLRLREEASRFLIQEPEMGRQVELDSEAVKDARDTYLLAGHQIRNIVDDMQRWSLHKNSVDSLTEELLQVKLELSKAQVKTCAEATRPSSMHRVSIRLIPLGALGGALRWVCWLGGPEPTQTTIHGIGDSPDLAARAFDAAYLENLTAEQQMVPVPQVPTAPAIQPQSEKKRKKR